jgi:hypothetical protein
MKEYGKIFENINEEIIQAILTKTNQIYEILVNPSIH